MEINSPEQLMGAIRLLVVQMDRKQRKQFLMWIKRLRNEYDFTYPEGQKLEAIKEKLDEKHPVVDIIVPTTGLVDASGSAIISTPSGASVIRDSVPSNDSTGNKNS